ncbi:MAG: hypothetical protein N2C12_17925, partial [Planctomycetales bacterium]
MVFQHVEKLKRDYTDKFVIVDDSRPELARFRGQTGRVKTINMNGRALVEFDHYANIGWFDIDVDYLKVVNRPLPKQQDKTAPKPTKKSAATPASTSGEKKLSPLEMARMQDSKATQQEATGKDKPALSTADILAAARGSKSDEKKAEMPAAKAAQSSEEMTLADKLAAARGNASTAAAKPTTEKPKSAPAAKSADEMTLTEKLAAARGGPQQPAEESTPSEAEAEPTEASKSTTQAVDRS